jgi:putative transposase
MKTYKFRIYPNKQQIQYLEESIEICRLLYNESLEERRKDSSLSYYEQKRRLTQKRKILDTLKRVHSQVLQNVMLRLERAFQNYNRLQSILLRRQRASGSFHRDKSLGYPKFRRHGRYNSLIYPQYGSFEIKENKLKLAFVNGLIKVKLHRLIIGEIKTCTIVRDIDRWFACFSCDSVVRNTNNNTIGVDVGLLNWMTLSNGQVIDRPAFLKNSIQKIKKLQRSVSQKKRGSKNRNKIRIKLAKAWRKVRLQREDYCQKITTNLAKRFGTIIFEKLSIANMTKNHNLAASIFDATWYKLKQLAAYKAEVISVNPINTSQRCSRCQNILKAKMDLSVRTYECPKCGLVLGRDYNSALDILRLGQELTFAERKPILVKNKQVIFNEARSPDIMGGSQ